MPLLSRSLRSPLPSLSLSSLAPNGFSLSFFRPSLPPFFVIPPLCRTQSLPPESPSPPPATFSVRFDCALIRTSFSTSDVLPPPPLTVLFLLRRHHRPPPRLIHIHAVVIVCRLPAGGHYYTSCARSRHREATTPATLLLLLPPFLSPSFFSFASLILRCCFVVFWLHAVPATTTPVSFTIASPRIIRGRITQFSRRGSLSAACARESSQIIARKLFFKTPREET